MQLTDCCDPTNVVAAIQTAGFIEDISPTSSHKENSSSLINQIANLPGFNPLKARLVKQYSKASIEEILPTAVEKSLPWRRDRSSYNFGMFIGLTEICICIKVHPILFRDVNALVNAFLLLVST